jgi:cation diffusion facilitator family transporter
MDNSTNPYREGRRAAGRGILISLGLGLTKFLGGLFGHSLALLSDAVHSLVDAAISAGLLAALHVAERPADQEHPYGHGRAEAVAGAGIALLLLLLASGIAWEAISTVQNRFPAPAAFTIALAAGGAMAQEGLYRYVSRVARRTGSGALMATAWDYRLDALGALAVVVGVTLARWGGPSWHWADHAAALVVAGTVFWVAGGLLKENINDLMDRQADPELLDAVRREAASVERVLGVEKLRIRKSGLESLVDIHIEVAPDQTVESGHKIAHAVKDRIMSEIPAIRDVLVHVEPHFRSTRTESTARAESSKEST